MGALLASVLGFSAFRDGPASENFIAWARANAVPLTVPDADSCSPRIDRLRTIIGDARVVALGEPAHGAHEPLALRNGLLRCLAENLGFTAIALETGLSESRVLYDYALGGQGEVSDVARDGFTWGFGRYTENVEMLIWVRQFNALRAPGERLRIYGIDMAGGDDTEFPLARRALEDVLRFLELAVPDQSRSVRVATSTFLDRFTHEAYWLLSEGERKRLTEVIASLAAFLESNRATLVESATPEDLDWAQRNIAVSGQLASFFESWPAGASGGDPAAELHAAVAARDAAMAENVRWVTDREGSGGRVLVFAHNAHIMTTPPRGTSRTAESQPPPMMGWHLRKRFRSRLLTIGVSAAANEPGLPGESVPPGEFDLALARTGRQPFLIDLRAAHSDPAVELWLQQPRSMRANFTDDLQIAPREAFDAVIHFGRLTAAGGSAVH